MHNFRLLAFLLLSLSACDTSIKDPPARYGAECVRACEAREPEGLKKYEVVISACVCTSCSEDCAQAVCSDKEPPSDTCLPCVQDSLDGPNCDEHGGLFRTGCLGYPECRAFVDCVVDCELPPVQ